LHPSARTWREGFVLPVVREAPMKRFFLLGVLGASAFAASYLVIHFTKTSPQQTPANDPAGMVWIPGGEFTRGSDNPKMRDAQPLHRIKVDGFWMDRTAVTNEQFAQFVDATGYVTVAERTPEAKDFPGAPPENLAAGSIVFTPPNGPVPLDNHFRWWS